MSDGGDDTFAKGGDGEMFDLVDGRLGQDELDELLIWCSRKKVSDITIESGQPVWVDIGGILRRVTSRRISHPEVSDLVRATYGDNGPGMCNSGVALDYAYEFRRAVDPSVNGVGGRMRFRMNVTCGRMIGGRGFQITTRTLPSQPVEVSKLGLEREILEYLRPPQGLNIFTGPTGSGKSTVMSSLLRYRCEQVGVNEKIIEYSRPIEYVYDRLHFPDSFIAQIDVGDHLRNPDQGPMHQSIWAFCVANALRRKPKIIVIGEARDKETIAACIMASLTGHLTMTTMHTNGAADTVSRIVMEFGPEERRGMALNLLGCLNMVVTQLLMPQVGGGVVGCREFMVFDRKAKSALVGISPDDWRDRISEMMNDRQVVGRTMAESAKALLAAGRITPETYEDFAARGSGESKLMRDATGRGILGRSALQDRE